MWKPYSLTWILIFFCFIELGWFAGNAHAQTAEQPFHVVLWNQPGGLLDDATKPSIPIQALREHWFQSLLPLHTNHTLQIHVSTDHSLERYIQDVNTLKPPCLEGEIHLVETLWCDADQDRYIPILKTNAVENDLEAGEIIFVQGHPQWQGTLGILHPDYARGGHAQIERWREETGSEPSWVTYPSARELLFHLFVGTIDAAAVPSGAFEAFIHEQGREDLASHVSRISIQRPDMQVAVFLRKDWYNNPLYRTLIGETWLRDLFPSRFQNVPKYWAYSLTYPSNTETESQQIIPIYQ